MPTSVFGAFAVWKIGELAWTLSVFRLKHIRLDEARNKPVAIVFLAFSKV